jgi:hypothetical protein
MIESWRALLFHETLNITAWLYAGSPLSSKLLGESSFDFYSFLKSKKMVNGIPALLCYKKSNATYIPDDIVTGSDPQQLHQFFTRCGKHLMDALTQQVKK